MFCVGFWLYWNSSEEEFKTHKSEYMEFQYPAYYELEVLPSGITVELIETEDKAMRIGVYTKDEYDGWKKANNNNLDIVYSKTSVEIGGVECDLYTDFNGAERTYFFEKNGKYYVLTYWLIRGGEISPEARNN